jgi:hypothetical protein
MLSDPALFMDCITLVYKPRNAPTSESTDDSRKAGAELGWSVLHHGRGVPGQNDDGSINAAKFADWVTTARKIAADTDRQAVTDIILGEWLSNCPADSDGTWPCGPVRDLLERPESKDIGRGFHTGVINNRGVHSRAPGDGGAQERALAQRYHDFAKLLLGSHPATAAVLEGIAGSYHRQAAEQDDDAKLWREGAR